MPRSRPLASAPASVLLVEPTAASLTRIVASGQIVRAERAGRGDRTAVRPSGRDSGRSRRHGWREPAGPATGTGQQCYTSTSGPTLVQLQVRGRVVTVLGTAAPLTNAELAHQGNAALSVNLLPSRRIVWLVPPAVGRRCDRHQGTQDLLQPAAAAGLSGRHPAGIRRSARRSAGALVVSGSSSPSRCPSSYVPRKPPKDTGACTSPGTPAARPQRRSARQRSAASRERPGSRTAPVRRQSARPSRSALAQTRQGSPICCTGRRRAAIRRSSPWHANLTNWSER